MFIFAQYLCSEQWSFRNLFVHASIRIANSSSNYAFVVDENDFVLCLALDVVALLVSWAESKSHSSPT
jgi:hypothetical protein